MINEELNKKRGKRLKECREQQNMTQNELAIKVNCSPQSISYIENGKRGMSRDLAHAFANELSINEEYILCESDFKTDSEKIKHEESIINLVDSATYKYLKSLGHDIAFFSCPSEDDGVILTLNNDIFEASKKNYGNDLLYSDQSTGMQLLMEDSTVEIDNFKIPLIDYFDLIDDLREYAEFLIRNLNSRLDKHFNHIETFVKEEKRRNKKNINDRLEIVKKDFGELHNELLANLIKG